MNVPAKIGEFGNVLMIASMPIIFIPVMAHRYKPALTAMTFKGNRDAMAAKIESVKL